MSRPRRAAGFWLYAITLATLTHWPALRVEAPIERPDLLIHLGAFGLWTLLLAGLVRSPLAVGLIASCYAALDEGTQAIPILHRTAGWDDLAADLLGVWLAVALVALLRRFARSDNPPSDPADALPPDDPDQPAAPAGR